MLRSIRNTTLKTIGTGIVVLATIEVTTKLPSEGRSSQLYHDVSDKLVTPLIRRLLNPEDAHNMAIYFTNKGFAPTHRPNKNESTKSISLQSRGPKGLIFPSCVGLAAGFDKDGVAIKGLMDMGFGFVEIGSVTPKPQPGNPKPRMFRLLEDEGVINRFGFNSVGMAAVEENLKAFRHGDDTSKNSSDDTDINIPSQIVHLLGKAWNIIFPPMTPLKPTILGVNLGKNKTSTHETEDYELGIQKLGPYADYLVVNISSPNTPGLRNLQKNEPIRRLLQAAISKRNALVDHSTKILPPLFVKVAPDLSDEDMKDIASAVMEIGVDGILVTNTSNQRPDSLVSRNSGETGGLSGLPIRDLSTECIRKMYNLTGGNVFIIGIGGVGSGRDAYEKLKAGAGVVQVYSRMVYEGPGVVSRIRKELTELMVENGQKNVEDVVGLDHEVIYWEKRMRRLQEARAKEKVMVDM